MLCLCLCLADELAADASDSEIEVDLGNVPPEGVAAMARAGHLVLEDEEPEELDAEHGSEPDVDGEHEMRNKQLAADEAMARALAHGAKVLPNRAGHDRSQPQLFLFGGGGRELS